MNDSTNRFSDRVESYVKYRPSYPNTTIDCLIRACSLPSKARIADIGSGTGILSRLLLDRGFQVQAVEPNKPMREAAERDLSKFENFDSISGTAEATTIPDDSVDLVIAAQAFHWFDRLKCKAEFRRILKPDGKLAIVWNERQTDSSPFLRAYENLLLESATDYSTVNHSNIGVPELEAYFAPHPLGQRKFPNRQSFDYQGLKGRCLSSSYIPATDHPKHLTFFRKLEELFEEHKQDGQVHFEYWTTLFYGQLS